MTAKAMVVHFQKESPVNKKKPGDFSPGFFFIGRGGGAPHRNIDNPLISVGILGINRCQLGTNLAPQVVPRILAKLPGPWVNTGDPSLG
ncbi:hypothetical protein DyAD56_07845 [Dyella sp. AD56]|nr:hypothetical protein DyAD56_07845 [Dyella sp. AD56]